jgi:hypothetical protein
VAATDACLGKVTARRGIAGITLPVERKGLSMQWTKGMWELPMVGCASEMQVLMKDALRLLHPRATLWERMMLASSCRLVYVALAPQPWPCLVALPGLFLTGPRWQPHQGPDHELPAHLLPQLAAPARLSAGVHHAHHPRAPGGEGSRRAATMVLATHRGSMICAHGLRQTQHYLSQLTMLTLRKGNR